MIKEDNYHQNTRFVAESNMFSMYDNHLIYMYITFWKELMDRLFSLGFYLAIFGDFRYQLYNNFEACKQPFFLIFQLFDFSSKIPNSSS